MLLFSRPVGERGGFPGALGVSAFGVLIFPDLSLRGFAGVAIDLRAIPQMVAAARPTDLIDPFLAAFLTLPVLSTTFALIANP